MQYGIIVNADGSATFVIENTGLTIIAASTILPGTTYGLLVKRSGGLLKANLNAIEKSSQASVHSLTSRSNTRLLARASAADGSTATVFFGGTLFLACYDDDDIPAFETWFNRTCYEDFGFDY